MLRPITVALPEEQDDDATQPHAGPPPGEKRGYYPRLRTSLVRRLAVRSPRLPPATFPKPSGLDMTNTARPIAKVTEDATRQ